MNKKKKKVFFLFIPLIIVISFFALKFWGQEGCLETEVVFNESFDTTNFKDEENSAVDHWGEGYVTPKIAGIFQTIPTSISFPTWVNTVAHADFDEDGYIDAIGTSDVDYRHIVYLKNELISGQRGFQELSPAILDEGNYTGRLVGLLAGDFDKDGHQDFMYLYASTGTGDVGSISRLWFYKHLGTVGGTGVPEFTHYNYTTNTTLLSAMEGLGWVSTHETIDIDLDGDIDILFANGYGKVILLRNDGTKPLSDTTKFTGSTLINARTGESGNRWNEKGICVIGTGDFDNDNDVDIIVGALNWRGLKYYKNDGTGNFTLHTVMGYIGSSPDLHDNIYDGAATAIAVADYDGDGDLDFMIGTDNWIPQETPYPPEYETGAYRTDCGQSHGTGTRLGGNVFYFKNDGTGAFTSTLVQDSQLMLDEGQCAAWDLDFGFPIDFEGDGDMDFIIFDGNQSEFYYWWENVLTNRYNLEGTAVSKNITADAFPPDGINQETESITKVQFSSLSQSVKGASSGLKVTYYVSNNGGKNWEFYVEYEGAAIQNYTDLPVHTFDTFGADIRWKAVFSAPDDFPDPGDEFHETSKDAVKIDAIQIKFHYVGKQEYSRTSVVSTSVVDGSETKKLIIGASFIYPSWQGQLRAYDLTNLAPSETSSSVIRIVTQPDLGSPTGREIAEGAEMFWDAGELLASRAAIDRTIYTAVPEASTLTRLPFDTTAEHLAILEPLLADVNGDNEGLINFIRGEGREWKLGDINHSNPMVIGPPDGAPLLKGDGYLDFMNTWKDRPKVLYVGANDGMLHCFDVLTGQELWAFIPYNLLPKLKNMWAVYPTTGTRYFLRDDYVDGTPVIEDVYIDANGDDSKEWITILICGQGPGKGSTIGGGLNYYFAFNITDPENPQPLWEFTDSTMGETWSEPAIGRIDKQGGDASGTWVAFVGSGYDNDPDQVVGNSFYAIDLESGTKFWSFSDTGVNTITQHAFTWDIANTFPGCPSIVDTDQDGNAERVYVGDLDGRVWKIDVSITFTGEDSWTAVKLYEDSRNYPILSKPEVWMKPGAVGAAPRIYFGTGGDDTAPSDVTYSFIALTDGNTPEVEWFIGDYAVLGLPEAKSTGVFDVGEKVWANPQVANYIVYFSTLKGNIESIDPCENVLGIGKLYARYVQAVAGSVLGQTALTVGAEKKASIELAIKTRAAVTLGERQRTSGGSRKREVYIQEYDSTIQKLEQSIAPTLKIESWREVKRIIK